MVAINNLHGRVAGVQGKVLYKEALPHNLAFVIVEKFATADGKTHNGSHLDIEAAIVGNQLHDSGKVHYFGYSYGPQPANKKLEEFRTKDGFLVKKLPKGACTIEEGVATHFIHDWMIEEVPKSFLLKFLK